LESDTTVTTDISLLVEEEVEDNFVVDVYGDNEVMLSGTIIIYAKVYNNGEIDENMGVLWTISNLDESTNTYVSIIEQDTHTITLKASSNINYKNKYVDIKGILIDDGSIFDIHTIKLTSLF
jgi:hypothetical protein